MITRIFLLSKIPALILLIWVAHILFLNQPAKWGMNGDDWMMLFYWDSRLSVDLSNLFSVANEFGNIVYSAQIYYIGILRSIFGLNQTAFKLLDLLWKSLAAFSAAYLVFKLTKDKLLAALVVFFFIIFPSTAGVLSHVVLGPGYLTIAFMSFSILFYIHSAKRERKILFASLFFFLALAVSPNRAYLLVPLPFFVEVVRMIKSFKSSGFLNPVLGFLNRLIIFYFLPFILLRSNPGAFEPTKELFVRLKQLTSGNLYTLSLPFQTISTLFIDQSILKEVIAWRKSLLPATNSYLGGFIVLNIILLFLSIALGVFITERRKVAGFVFKIMVSTLFLEIFFYLFGKFSSSNNMIPFKDFEGFTYWQAPFDPTIYQASIGGYIFILGLVLFLEWWRNQRDNKILMVTVFAWFWVISSETVLYLTNSWWNMVTESNDKYILICSIGAVIFTAGILTLSLQATARIKNLNLKTLVFSILIGITLLVSYKDYKYLNKYYYYWNEGEGGSVFWQESMYQRFLAKFGKENLSRSIFLYIDNDKYVLPKTQIMIFHQGSFYNPIGYRVFYDENGHLIRGNCKVLTNDINTVKKAYTIYDGEKGFIYDTACIDPKRSTRGVRVFYPLSNFYAYRMENKDFIDIKDKILAELDQTEIN